MPLARSALRFVLAGSLAAGLGLAAGACVHVHSAPQAKKGQGPPAHAPAHGYRKKHASGVELVFDSGLGVYVVLGIPDCYYDDHRFYRLEKGVWKTAPDPKGTWTAAADRDLPPGLRRHDGPAKHDRGGPKSMGLSASRTPALDTHGAQRASSGRNRGTDVPVRTRIDRERGLIEIVFDGVVTAAEIEELLSAQVDAPEGGALLPLGLFDTTAMSRADFPTDLLWRMTKRLSESVDPRLSAGKVAVVATRPEAFGLSRIYQSLRDQSPVEVRVFRERAEAERWLGLSA
jgi:hypothetical protein